MIKSITVTNPRGESLLLELAKPEDTGLAVVSLDGIGPVDATINMSEVSTMDGAIFNSARKTYRFMGVTLVYDWRVGDVEDLRHKAYRYFPTKKKVRLEIETDTRTVYTEGYVETHEPSIFSNNEGSDITIKCPDPYFYSTAHDNEVIFSVDSPMFEFDFEDDPTPSLVLGSLDVYQTKVIQYEGDTDVGMVITLHAIGGASFPTVYNYETGEHLSLDTDKLAAITGQGIIAGDDIVINTVNGQKSVTLVRNGVPINILNCLDRNADWLRLYPGDNIVAYTTDPVEGALNLQMKVSNRVAYDGV